MTAAFPGLMKAIDAGMDGNTPESCVLLVDIWVVLVANLNRPDRLGLAGIITISSGAQYFVSCGTGISLVDPDTMY